MKKRSKGQSTIEFTILMSFMILMFSVFFVLVGQRLVELRSDRNYEIAKTIQNIVSNEFQLAKIVEDGYTRQFKLPGSIEGVNYQISMTNDTELNIDVGGKTIYSRIPENVTGNISKGLNEIKKTNGTIHINGFMSNLSNACNCGVIYYFGWITNTCYYGSTTANITCNYDGSCKTAAQICSAGNGEQGITTGIVRTTCKEISGCSCTIVPTLINISAGTDPYDECVTDCDGVGNCIGVSACILDTSLITCSLG